MESLEREEDFTAAGLRTAGNIETMREHNISSKLTKEKEDSYILLLIKNKAQLINT